MYKNLLVATDGSKLSDKALAHAIGIAQAYSQVMVDGYDLDVGETINCPECSAELRVTSIDPIAVTSADGEE